MIAYRAALLASVLLCHASTANALFLSGNNLWDMCEHNHEVAAAVIAGIADGLVTFAGADSKAPIICIRPNVTLEQLGDEVCDYLRDNPKYRDTNAAAHVFGVLMADYPCRR
jgi:Rap1a immunity proteins